MHDLATGKTSSDPQKPFVSGALAASNNTPAKRGYRGTSSGEESGSSSGRHSPMDLSGNNKSRIQHDDDEDDDDEVEEEEDHAQDLSSHGRNSSKDLEEIKRRRLDDILHRKFPSSTPISSRDGRKRKHPSSSSEPANLNNNLSLRPDLYPTPEHRDEDASMQAGRLLQLAALFNGDLFKSNPLLYYGYYAQILQNLQQRPKNDLPSESESIKNINNNENHSLVSSTPAGYSTPETKQGKSRSNNYNLSSLLCTPSSPSSATSSPQTNGPPGSEITPPLPFREDHTPASPASSPDEEPRKRAPRALTGRHVRPGTGASPKTLSLLRKKVQERLRLREEAEEGRKPAKKSKKISA